MKAVRGGNHIGYGFSQKGSVTFQSMDPAANELLPVHFHEATAEETDEAIRLATAAFPVYSELPVQKRAEFMKAIAKAMEESAEELIQAFSTESGLPKDRARTELTRNSFQLESYANAILNGTVLNAVIDSADPDRKPAPKPDLRKVNIGLGPVVVFGASNFPFAYSTMGGDSASALAAGCPVIVKGHAMHPYTSELVAEIIINTAKATGMPEGVFSHLQAKGFTVGEQLVKDERIKAVGFTGSFNGGMALRKLAQERKIPIPVFAEMGSVNPVVVLPQAIQKNRKEIAEKVAASVALNAGQFCTSPGLLFLTESPESSDFVSQLTGLLEKTPAQVMLNPSIKKNYESSKAFQREGAEILAENADEPLNTIHPAVFSIPGKEFIENEKRQEEVFGSFILVISCKDGNQLLECLSVLNGQLTASVFTDSAEQELGSQCVQLLSQKVGRVIVNGVPTGVEVSPAQQHGGTFPATTDSRFTSVGDSAISRFMRPVAFQNFPDEMLPSSLKSRNPLNILRFVNGNWTSSPC